MCKMLVTVLEFSVGKCKRKIKTYRHHWMIFVLLIHLPHVDKFVLQLFHAPHLTASQATYKNRRFTHKCATLGKIKNY